MKALHRDDGVPFHWLALGATAVASLIYAMRYVHMLLGGHGVFAEDFSVFYQALHVFDAYPPARPYHPEALASYLGGAGKYHTYINPPFFLLLLWPLHGLSYQVALAVWIALPLAMWAWVLARPAVRRMWPGLAALGPWRYGAICACATLPFALNTLFSGQSGMWLAGLMLLGAAWRAEKPLRAGAIFALMAYKPHFAVVALLWLLAERNIRALAAFMVMGVILFAAPTLVWGVDIWREWLQALQGQTEIMRLAPQRFLEQWVSVYGAARLLGLSHLAGLAAQGANIGLCALALLYTYKHGVAWLVCLLWFVAALGFSPYAYYYDSALLIPAFLLLLQLCVRSQAVMPALTRLALIITLFLCIAGPQAQLQGVPLGAIALLMLEIQGFALAGRFVQEAVSQAE